MKEYCTTKLASELLMKPFAVLFSFKMLGKHVTLSAELCSQVAIASHQFCICRAAPKLSSALAVALVLSGAAKLHNTQELCGDNAMGHERVKRSCSHSAFCTICWKELWSCYFLAMLGMMGST